MENNLWTYKAIVISVYDGDTCTVDIDLGLHCWLKNEKIRLNRINAPELKGKQRSKGIKSRDFLRSLILNKEIILQTIKDHREKYGRYLGEIWILNEKAKYENVNDIMVENKFAEYKEY